MDQAAFASPDLATFCRLDELGLVAVGQCLEPDRAVIECSGSRVGSVVSGLWLPSTVSGNGHAHVGS